MSPHRTHLAVMREPYLARVLSGRKTIESRFSRVRAAPYGQVAPGDRIWLKRSGGPIVAQAHVYDVREYAGLTPPRVAALVEQFGDALWLDADFVARAQGCRYAVLIWLDAVQVFPAPVFFSKRDRRGWVVIEQV